jgi:hypothetical protein
MSRGESQKALDWAAGGPAAGEAPPWASFDYLKLRETLEEIVSGMEAATQVEGEPATELQPASNLQRLLTHAEPDRTEACASDPPARP